MKVHRHAHLPKVMFSVECVESVMEPLAAFTGQKFIVRWMINQSGSAIEVRAARIDGGQLDTAGQAILKLLHKAAGAAEANSRRALETAQTLASQLRAAEDRIAELEAEVQHYREKSERAEEWLRKICMEIEDRLVKEPAEKRRQMSRRG